MLIRSLLLVVTLALAACSPHRPQTARPFPLPPQYPTAAEQTEVLTDHWWQAFTDPGLDALMARLFAENLDLAQSHARLMQSQSLMKQARALRYPQLSLQGETGSSSQPGITGDSQGESSRLSLAAGFEVDLFNRLGTRSRAALLNYQASEGDLQSLYLSLSAQTAELYYLAIEQRAQLMLADETISSYAESLQRVEDRYRSGVAAVIDLYQARQNLAAARANRLIYEQALASAENALAVLLGSYPGDLKFLQQAQIPAAPPQLPTGLPASLLQNRPDLRAAFLRVEAADAGVAAAIAERFPSVNLGAGYGVSSSNLTGRLISGDFWNLLLSLSQPLFDGGRRRAEVERNQAVFAEKVAAYQLSVLRAFQEVEDSLNGNRTSAERIERLAEREEATRAAQRLALERYLSGLTDYLPVLAAQVLHFNAQSQLLAARRQLLSQRISLARALGGSWMADQLLKDHQNLTSRRKNTP